MATSSSLFRHRFKSDPARERRQLAVLALGLGVIAAVLELSTDAAVGPVVLAGLAGVAGVGWLGFRWLGRAVYLMFALASGAIGRVVSWFVVGAIYWIGIGLFGSVLRLFGMNRLDRNFAACRARTSMLSDAPATSRPSFGRQS